MSVARNLATARKWARLGRRYGYPDCCIAAFIAGASARLDGTLASDGRVPCYACKLRAQADGDWRPPRLAEAAAA